MAFIAIASGAQAAPDPMAEYRERFKIGLARYQAGAVGESLQYWEPIYRELGPERGWRLAFNLARAYEGIGDITRAVERYEAFLEQVRARRAAGEKIEELIDREEHETRERLREIASTKGRIVLAAGDSPVAVKVDGSEPRLAGFSAYVAPGKHVVVFEPGTPRESRREIEVGAGQSIDVAAPAPEAPKPPPPPERTPVVTPRLEAAPPPVIAPEPARVVERPFSPAVLFVAGGAAVLSTIVPILTYQSASDFQSNNRLSADPGADAQNDRLRSEYDARRSTFYATLAIPITLGALTAGLTGFYFLGGRDRQPFSSLYFRK